MSDQQIEKMIQERGLTAPRVTPDEIEALMRRVVYAAHFRPLNTTSTHVHAYLDGRFYLASGHSACVSPENFNEEIGYEAARQNAEREARNKLWELEGYALFRSLHPEVRELTQAEADAIVEGTPENRLAERLGTQRAAEAAAVERVNPDTGTNVVGTYRGVDVYAAGNADELARQSGLDQQHNAPAMVQEGGEPVSDAVIRNRVGQVMRQRAPREGETGEGA